MLTCNYKILKIMSILEGDTCRCSCECVCYFRVVLNTLLELGIVILLLICCKILLLSTIIRSIITVFVSTNECLDMYEMYGNLS